jgi:methionyl-tRNA synthetase
VSRALSMVVRYFDGVIPVPADQQELEQGLRRIAESALAQVETHMNDLAFHKALVSIWEIVAAGNKYIDETAPWALAKKEEDRPRLGTVLYHSLEALRVIALLLAAFMPETAAKMWSQLGVEQALEQQNIRESGRWWGLKPGEKLSKPLPLFPRIEQVT